MNIETFDLPESWAAYLINGDCANGFAEDRDQANQFLRDHQLPLPVSCENAGFSWNNSAAYLGGNAAKGQALFTYTLDVRAIAAVLAADNSRFDYARFYDAAGLVQTAPGEYAQSLHEHSSACDCRHKAA